jgi:membrane-associated protease RseP (regulator of RpoE activity)
MKFIYTITIALFISTFSLASDCEKKCKVSRLVEEGVFLGVQINNVSPCQKNCIIQQVIPNTAAEKAGLKAGDIIVKVDNNEVNPENQLVNIIANYKAGDKVTITYASGETTKKMKVRLGAKSTRIVEEMECCEEVKETSNVVVETGVSVFPNPAKNTINISTKEALEGDVHMMIYSQEGKEMFYNIKTMDENMNYNLDVSQFNNGAYFVRIETAKTNYVQKFEILR